MGTTRPSGMPRTERERALKLQGEALAKKERRRMGGRR